MAEATDVSDLGKATQEFRPGNWLYPFIGALIALVIFVPTTVVVKSNDTNNENKLVPVLAIGSAISAGATVVFAILLFGSFNRKVVIHENGIVIGGLGTTHVLEWENIAKVFYSMRSVLVYQTWLQTDDKTKIEIPSTIRGQYTIFTEISKVIRPRIRKRWKKSLEEGKSVLLSKELTYTSTGLVVKQQTFRWDQLKHVGLGAHLADPTNANAVQSVLTISTLHEEFRLRTVDIPNFLILLKVLESDHGVKVSRETKMFS